MSDTRPGNLFEAAARRDPSMTPLAQRMRPRTLDEVTGQQHLLGPGRVLRKAAESGRIPSMVLWGPPGTGKTTLAYLLAQATASAFEDLSAVSAGVRDLRAVVERAQQRRATEHRGTVLFVDEIHRFNKSQQDALLPHVEAGVVRLIGATTENPSFEVNAALLSRTRVFVLRQLTVDDLRTLAERALADAERGLGNERLAIVPEALELLVEAAAGDARRLLTGLELAADLVETSDRTITPEIAATAMGARLVRHDKGGDQHYDIASAMIKSLRASDADAAMYWMARLLEGGETPMFVARRLVIFAAEDVGCADPQALVIAEAAAAASHRVGMPEARLPLAQAVIHLALAPKSNSALRAYDAAAEDVRRHGALPVPPTVRNPVTGLMKAQGYGHGYRYPHEFPLGIDPEHESYLPELLAPKRSRDDGGRYVKVGRIGWERKAVEALERRRDAAAEAAGLPPRSVSHPSGAQSAFRPPEAESASEASTSDEPPVRGERSETKR